MAHYILNEQKVIFFAENRIDFRELMKELVAHFRMRIELRQIGVRDETRVTGGGAEEASPQREVYHPRRRELQNYGNQHFYRIHSPFGFRGKAIGNPGVLVGTGRWRELEASPRGTGGVISRR